MSLGGGDKLARGGVRATFGSVEGTSADKWAEAFGNFDPKAYLEKTEQEELERQARKAQKLLDEEAEDERERQRVRDPNVGSNGDVSLNVGETSASA